VCDFDNSLNDAIKKLVAKTNEFLEKHFKTNIVLDISVDSFENQLEAPKDSQKGKVKTKNVDILVKNASVNIKISLFGKKIENHQDFFERSTSFSLSNLYVFGIIAGYSRASKPKNIIFGRYFYRLGYEQSLTLVGYFKK
jgi:hypothetical protein